MEIRNILLSVDGPASLASLVPPADRLASDVGAGRLIIAALGEVSVPVTAASLNLPVVHARERGLQGLIDRMREEATGLGLTTPVDWRGEVTAAAEVRLARLSVLADLVVTPGATRRLEPLRRLDVGALVLSAGRPVLVAPRVRPDFRFRRVLVGFKSTREGRAALSGSLPLLRAAERVVLAVIGEGASRAEADDAAAFLGEHGAAVTIRRVEDVSDAEAGEALLALAREEASDLLVTGAYGRGRARERIFGGVTRTLLEEARLPCLFVH